MERVTGSAHNRRMGGIWKWFQHKDSSSHGSMKKKDRARAENAHMHDALSVAGLAAPLEEVSAAEDSSSSTSKMSRALASATELLASHCIEMAEQTGADHDRVASSVRSAVDVRSPGDFMTLTAAAATEEGAYGDVCMIHNIPFLLLQGLTLQSKLVNLAPPCLIV